MNPASLEPRPWPRHRWGVLIGLVFAAHVGLIFALGDRRTVGPRQPAFVPTLSLAADFREISALNDPTLFALPRHEGFGGAVWVEVPKLPARSERRTGSARWLALPLEQLGTTFARFMQTNTFAGFHLEPGPAPELTLPAPLPDEAAPAAGSTLRLEGDLAQRKLRTAFELPSWPPSPDPLTESVVQVLVDAAGNVISPPILLSGSTSSDADRYTLNLAQAARFEPLPRNGHDAAIPAARLSLGTLVFLWETAHPPPTNVPAANP